MKKYLKKLASGENLTGQEMYEALDQVLDEGATTAQIAAFLSLLRQKGETVEEIIGATRALQRKARHIKPNLDQYIDFVGTGGDGANTFNITTTAVFVTAAAGVAIAKHGNRAVTGKCGSVDVLEALGINLDLPEVRIEESVNYLGLGFMSARYFNPFMKNVAAVRAELGFRTIFNILGPISNPADAKAQVIGVFDPKLTRPLAEAMHGMGQKRGMVFSCGGIDEFTTLGVTTVSEIYDQKIVDYVVAPEDFGFSRSTLAEIAGGTAEENAQITRSILSGQLKGAPLETVLLNAGAGIYMGGKARSMAEGVHLAQALITSGAAYKKLDQLIAFTNGGSSDDLG